MLSGDISPPRFARLLTLLALLPLRCLKSAAGALCLFTAARARDMPQVLSRFAAECFDAAAAASGVRRCRHTLFRVFRYATDDDACRYAR